MLARRVQSKIHFFSKNIDFFAIFEANPKNRQFGFQCITNLENREFLSRRSATIGGALFRWSGELPVANPGSGMPSVRDVQKRELLVNFVKVTLYYVFSILTQFLASITIYEVCFRCEEIAGKNHGNIY